MSVYDMAIPRGLFRAVQDDEAAAETRRRIAEMLRNGEAVNINHEGVLHTPGSRDGARSSGNVVDGEVELVIPSGKLA